MSNAEWLFIQENPNDRMRSTSRRHVLNSPNLPHGDRLVREAIQNSVDAAVAGKKTDILIWNKTVSGNNVRAFAQVLGLEHHDSPFARINDLGLHVGNALATMQTPESQSFGVTIIEDNNTCGLGYDDTKGVDRFEELCLSHGQDETFADPERGGSYGFGKEVYEAASDCNLFVVYSAFEPSIRIKEAGSHARLFGCATFNGHTRNGMKYTGRALFGVHRQQDDSKLIECRPLVDDEAHTVAEALGFNRRRPIDLGTSIMIVGSQVDMADFKRAVEDYWWPRILSNQLLVELWDEGTVLPEPDPRQRQDLMPYIRCYSLIEERVPLDQAEERAPFNAINGLKPGELALKALPEPSLDTQNGEIGELEEESPLRNTVALIRSRPRMVVGYKHQGGSGGGDYAGVFVSHPDVEQVLHLSEPPAHDEWNPDSQRITDSYSLQEATRKSELVKSILARIKTYARKFQRDLAQPPEPTAIAGSLKPEQLLAQMMSARIPSRSSGPHGDPDHFALEIVESRDNEVTRSRVTATVKAKLRDDAPQDTQEATLSIYPIITLDDDRRREKSERLELVHATLDNDLVSIEQGHSVALTLSKSSTTEVTVESAWFDRALYASIDVQMESVSR